MQSFAAVKARGVTPDVAALAASAGRELGAKRTDVYGQLPQAVPAPDGSAKVRRLREWESKHTG